MKPQRFRKKPVVVEAMHYDGSNGPAIHEWSPMVGGWATADVPLAIPTREGVMIANVGDWIIKGIAGEFYPCKPDIFEATYVSERNE